ncbi:MAG TPA: tetratricopeptide repeat protein [Myxococcota bacterium]|jgi:tetratricopeptide (TPR) repeat protein
MSIRSTLFALCAAAALACAASQDGFPREKAAAWDTAFQKGSAAHAAGQYEEAERQLRQALEIAQAEQPPGLRTGLALNGLAAISIDRGRFAEADPTLRRAIALLEAGNATQSLHYAAALANAGELALRQDQPAEAEPRFARAVLIAEAQPAQPAATPILQRSLAGLAESMRDQGRGDEADALAPRIETLCKKNPSPVCASISR